MSYKEIISTNCCAMKQLAFDDKVTMKGLERMLKEARVGNSFDDYTTLIAITTPEEKEQEKMLVDLGFKMQFTFNRRKEYGGGKLKFFKLDL